MPEPSDTRIIYNHLNWIIPAAVALIAFGGQFSASLWAAGGRVEKYDAVVARVADVEKRLDILTTADVAHDLVQAHLDERFLALIVDLARLHSEVTETNKHLTAVEDFLARKGSPARDIK